MDAEQRQKLTDLCTQQHVLVLSTVGEEWPTGHFQAFGQTPDLDLILIVLDGSGKYLNLLKNPHVTAVIDNRDTGDITKLDIIRATIQGTAREVQRDSAEWNELKDVFLKKNPFEEPFFGYDTLRMVRVAPKRISYADGPANHFKVEM
jgi:nitroimidazol reductase NimA-like FMN-containing flavoprotein (pyridoxamine 5'-phosphate oxidase superfamily)